MFNLELHESHRLVTYYHILIIRAEQASEKNDWTNLINFIKKMSEAYESTNEFKATIDNAVYTPQWVTDSYRQIMVDAGARYVTVRQFNSRTYDLMKECGIWGFSPNNV
jgi:hypothetical protein